MNSICMQLASVIFFMCVFAACVASAPGQTAQGKQGISGSIYWFQGNMMPGPDRPAVRGQGVVREIYILPLVKSQDLTGQGPLYAEIPFEPVAVVRSDESGKFFAILEPGIYSVFTREADGWYANLTDGQMRVHPVEVVQGTFTNVKIEINYMAFY
ncbi:MAG: carboxypeptidase regulatory-like domain-containing protein [Cyclobacteriaceae bacterium]|nr:carboxypeptidase regulatory-like domain-containing protein [Cyclobacteriaceae bacterium]